MVHDISYLDHSQRARNHHPDEIKQDAKVCLFSSFLSFYSFSLSRRPCFTCVWKVVVCEKEHAVLEGNLKELGTKDFLKLNRKEERRGHWGSTGLDLLERRGGKKRERDCVSLVSVIFPRYIHTFIFFSCVALRSFSFYRRIWMGWSGVEGSICRVEREALNRTRGVSVARRIVCLQSGWMWPL